MKRALKQKVFKSPRIFGISTTKGHLSLRRMLKAGSLQELIHIAGEGSHNPINIVLPQPKRTVELSSSKAIHDFLIQNPEQTGQVMNALRTTPTLLSQLEEIPANPAKKLVKKISQDILAEQKGHSLMRLAKNSPSRGFVESVRHISSPRREIRMAAMQSLIFIGNLSNFSKYASKIESLVANQYLKEKSAYARNNIAYSAGHSKNPAFCKLLQHIALNDKSTYVVSTAIDYLSKNLTTYPADERPKIITIFLKKLSHRQVDVRGKSLKALAEHEPRNGIAAAKRFLSSTKTQIDKQNALRSLKIVLEKHPKFKVIVLKIMLRELNKREKLSPKAREKEEYYEKDLKEFFKTNKIN